MHHDLPHLTLCRESANHEYPGLAVMDFLIAQRISNVLYVTWDKKWHAEEVVLETKVFLLENKKLQLDGLRQT